MRRRHFFAIAASATGLFPRTGMSQKPERVRRIGVLMGQTGNDSYNQAKVSAFRDALHKLGWTEGHNLQIDTNWATVADLGSMQRFAKELVALRPDLIVSELTQTTAALLQETRTIPIIFATVSDPVGSGFVASFSHPGGNVTGFTSLEPTMTKQPACEWAMI